MAFGFDLPCKEEQHVPRRLRKVDLHHSDECGVEVVGFRGLAVEHFDGEGATRDGEDGTLEEIGRVLFCVECGGGADQLKIGSPL